MKFWDLVAFLVVVGLMGSTPLASDVARTCQVRKQVRKLNRNKGSHLPGLAVAPDRAEPNHNISLPRLHRQRDSPHICSFIHLPGSSWEYLQLQFYIHERKCLPLSLLEFKSNLTDYLSSFLWTQGQRNLGIVGSKKSIFQKNFRNVLHS